ncbi:hypothetical protein ACFFX1_27195 [Dactylosporangium sucinum]|uniref:YtxH domain-containing protein n=1 Tax=Dactylosporangium sucinum TaxID=1424081 RepID=A0A917T0W5_9ACTN|nr:hypothetical protein [Dactylosporangium sucinum]GGM06527.1 hypothetical protein GCM10007977_004560 [Dactylosporangium sucinum]
MRLLTFAAGLAAGYVLGTRAGRPKYDQIVAGTRRLRANPTLAEARRVATDLTSAPVPADVPTVPATPAKAARRRSATNVAGEATNVAGEATAAKP